MFLWLFLLSLFALAASKCPLSSVEYNGSCYLKVPMIMTWGSAENICRLYGGHLASIHSMEQNDWLLKTLMGVKDPVSSGYTTTWIGAVLVNKKWIWTDGSPYDFDYFDDTQDNPVCCGTSIDNVPYCCGNVGMSVLTAPADLAPYVQGHWISIEDDQYYASSFICQLPLCDSNGQSAPSLITPNTTAGTGIYYLQTSDTYFFSAGGSDEIGGENLCNILDAHLPSVHNAFENTELVSVMNIFRKGVLFYFNFGLTTDNDGKNWHFTDGSAMTYTNWAVDLQNTTFRQVSYIQPFSGQWYQETDNPSFGHHLGCQLKRNLNTCQ